MSQVSQGVEDLVRCDGYGFRRALHAAATHLDLRAAELNALNVFPVPDGDTGTNMALTMQAALREVDTKAQRTVAAVARAAARGSLLGARGNSGVITSRFLHGFAQAIGNCAEIGPCELARALTEASVTAYDAVSNPVEGTMLTVSRDVAQAARRAAEDEGDLRSVLEAAMSAGRASVARTPELLPVLRQAGVVDAGGQGLVIMLEGFTHALLGTPIATPAVTVHPIAAKRVADHHHGSYGYCTEFIICGDALQVETIRGQLAELGDSMIVVGDADLVRVHIHAINPGPVLGYAASIGSLHQIKIDNMQEQNERLLAEDESADEAAQRTGRSPSADQSSVDEPSVVVVAAGPGFADVFRSLHAAVIIPGGQTMNPSTADLLRGVEKAPGRQVLLVPNNSNVLLAAQQVPLLTAKEVVVVPTRNMAEGVAALLAINYEVDLSTNARRMEQAARTLGSAEITRAVRDARLDGLTMQKGDTIGLIGGTVVCVGPDNLTVARELVERLRGERCEVVTLYYGHDVDVAEANLVAIALRTAWPGTEVEVIHGGQPHYHFIIAVE